jgi:hypothetical protein
MSNACYFVGGGSDGDFGSRGGERVGDVRNVCVCFPSVGFSSVRIFISCVFIGVTQVSLDYTFPFSIICRAGFFYFIMQYLVFCIYTD